jgi:hypothetical protein
MLPAEPRHFKTTAVKDDTATMKMNSHGIGVVPMGGGAQPRKAHVADGDRIALRKPPRQAAPDDDMRSSR